tara:strand:- start:3398 stop:3760 length:363 start_codon:yes stop_codon:yes gene_type:complete
MNNRRKIRDAITHNWGDETDALPKLLTAFERQVMVDTLTYQAAHKYQAPEVTIGVLMEPPRENFRLVNSQGCIFESDMRMPLPRIITYQGLTYLHKSEGLGTHTYQLTDTINIEGHIHGH